jgi:hypothetical protein
MRTEINYTSLKKKLIETKEIIYSQTVSKENNEI